MPQITTGRVNTKELIVYIIFAVFTITLWRFPFLFPLKAFVVFVHESCHALAAIITGGSVKEISVAGESGWTLTSGGNSILIYSAGYIGSSIFGSLMLIFSSRPKAVKSLTLAVFVLVLSMTILYVRNTFGFTFGLITAGVFFVTFLFSSLQITQYFLKFVAVMSVLYSIYDFLDYLVGNTEQTDAGMLANSLGMNPKVGGIFIGLIWSAISLIVIWLSLKKAISIKPTTSKQ